MRRECDVMEKLTIQYAIQMTKIRREKERSTYSVYNQNDVLQFDKANVDTRLMHSIKQCQLYCISFLSCEICHRSYKVSSLNQGFHSSSNKQSWNKFNLVHTTRGVELRRKDNGKHVYAPIHLQFTQMSISWPCHYQQRTFHRLKFQ